MCIVFFPHELFLESSRLVLFLAVDRQRPELIDRLIGQPIVTWSAHMSDVNRGACPDRVRMR